LRDVIVSFSSRVRFEQAGSRLTAVEIVRGSRAPIIAVLHRTLLALGIIISSYQARTSGSEIVERMVLERQDGGDIEASLSEATKALILRVAIYPGSAHPGSADVSDELANGAVNLG
jgi:hypothetical protein